MGVAGKRKEISPSHSSSFPSSSWSPSPLRGHDRNPLGSSIPYHLLHPASSQPLARFYSSTTDKADSRFYDSFEQAKDEGKVPHTKDQDAAESVAGDFAENVASVTPVWEAPRSTPDPTPPPSDNEISTEEPVGLSSSVSTQMVDSSSEAASEASSKSTEPSVFGFQSLSGLFRRAKPMARPVEDYRSTAEDQKPSSRRRTTRSRGEQSSTSTTLARTSRTDLSSHAAGKQPIDAPLDVWQYTTVGRPVRRRPNPFASSSASSGRTMQDGTDYKRDMSPGVMQTQAAKPWGLNIKDDIAVDSFLEPGSQTVVRSSTLKASTSAKRTKAMPANVERSATNSAVSVTTSGVTARLTHLTSSGEAHMVDVGAKESTRRVAVAFGTVRFSNPEAHRLIEENANKKGDVLGVARVAGIMAAKRTSDVVPLCHPIALTKIEVDVTLHATEAEIENLSHSAKHGLVAVQALVECTGPTGVEMEALSAASSAALTVYDMCKAVDRKMTIANLEVVYKSGGRSGIHGSQRWNRFVGKNFFAERGLERPSRGATQRPDDAISTKASVENEADRNLQLAENSGDRTPQHFGDKSVVRRVETSAEQSSRVTRDLASQGGDRKNEDYGSLWTPSPISPGNSQPEPSTTRDSSKLTSPQDANSSKAYTGADQASLKACETCGMSFDDTLSLNAHLKTEHPAGEIPARPQYCNLCSTTHPSKSAFAKHLVAEHGWTVEFEKFPGDGVDEKGAIRRKRNGAKTKIYRPPPTRTPAVDISAGTVGA